MPFTKWVSPFKSDWEEKFKKLQVESEEAAAEPEETRQEQIGRWKKKVEEERRKR